MSRSAPNIFKNIPEDYLNFFTPKTDPKKIADFLKLKKIDVANATNTPAASVRYDDKIPPEMLQTLQEIGVICDLVAAYFKGDLKKTALWFQISNPSFGNISPREMICCGRYKKLLKFILNALEGNNP